MSTPHPDVSAEDPVRLARRPFSEEESAAIRASTDQAYFLYGKEISLLRGDARLRALLDAATSLEGVVQGSPTAAGVLSAVVPGAGQALVGRWGEAASAIVVNGALVASAVELGRRETWFGMGLVSFLGVGFYGGNIVSAAQGAKLENRRAWSRALLPIEGAHGVKVVIEDGAVVVR
jgi:hypothetical protein